MNTRQAKKIISIEYRFKNWESDRQPYTHYQIKRAINVAYRCYPETSRQTMHWYNDTLNKNQSK